MKTNNFFKNSFILTLANLTTGILGFTFSIILSNELGPEGMGLYGLIMPIYNLFICLICGGMIIAISKVSAIYFSKNDFLNLNRSIDTSILFDIIWSSIIVLFVFLNSSFISKYIIKDIRTSTSIKIICPAMMFIAVSSILKGYFYGISKVKIPALIDVFEKTLRIFIIVLLIKVFSLKEINETVTAAYITLAIGEFMSSSLLYLFYKKNKQSQNITYGKSESRSQLLFNILVISLPLCLNGFLSTGISTVSTLMVPRRLVSCGIEYSTALSMIGKFSGMSLNIIFFPIVIVTSMSTILIPDISQSLSKKDYWGTENRINDVLKISFILGLSSLIICLTIPHSLGVMFFNRTDLGNYIKFLSLTAPIAYISTSTYGILNGLGKQKILLRNSLIASIEELILLYIFLGIKSINIYGYGLAIMITSFTNIILSFTEIKKDFDIGFNGSEILINSLLTILLFFILNILKNILPNSIFVLKNCIIIFTGFLLFFISVIVINKSQN